VNLQRPSQRDQLILGLVGGLVVISLVFFIPAAARRIAAAVPTPTPAPTPTVTAPPVAVLLESELERDLDGVMTIVNDGTFGTAFLIDSNGDFLTASSLVDSSTSLRLLDNTGGSHPVRVVGIDTTLGLAEIQATADGTPVVFGDPSGLAINDPLALLASRKVANLVTSSPAIVKEIAPGELITLSVDDLPGNLGGPIAGPGGKVLAILVRTGVALPIDQTQPDLVKWKGQGGSPRPLAPLPAHLILQGSGDTAPTPSAEPSAASGSLALTSINPTRTSTTQETLVTIQGNGFVNGGALAVRFVPVASPSGAFAGIAPTLVNPTTLTVKVPSGQLVQDYVIQLTNGDGSSATWSSAFSVTP